MRRLIMAPAALLVLAITVLTIGGTTALPASAVVTVSYHELVDHNALKCLDASTNNQNGELMQQWGCWNGPQQEWAFVPSPTHSGWYMIKNFKSGKCLDVSSVNLGGPQNNTANGALVQQWDCWNGPQQLWVPFGNMLVNYNSRKCLDVAGGGTNNGALVQQWTCWNGPQQQWTQA